MKYVRLPEQLPRGDTWRSRKMSRVELKSLVLLDKIIDCLVLVSRFVGVDL